MAEIYVTTAELTAVSDRLKNVETQTAAIAADVTDMKLASQREYFGLQDMIRVAVEDGNKEMQSSLREYTKKSSEQIENIEKRVHTLEDAESKKAQEEKEKQIEDKKDTKKWLFRCIITSVISVLGAILLNNLWDILTK